MTKNLFMTKQIEGSVKKLITSGVQSPLKKTGLNHTKVATTHKQMLYAILKNDY